MASKQTIKANLDKYLALTGQTDKELFAGAEFFGIPFIMETLVPQALKENKKIVYKDEPKQGLGAMSYSFQPL
jgi:hypothetical protein